MEFINNNIVWLIIIVVIIILAIIGYMADRSGFSQKIKEKKEKDRLKPIDEPEEEKIEFEEPVQENTDDANNVIDELQNSNQEEKIDVNNDELIFNDSENQNKKDEGSELMFKEQPVLNQTPESEELTFNIPESTEPVVQNEPEQQPVLNETPESEELTFNIPESPEPVAQKEPLEDNNELIFTDSEPEEKTDSNELAIEETKEDNTDNDSNKEEVIFNDPEIQNQFFPNSDTVNKNEEIDLPIEMDESNNINQQIDSNTRENDESFEEEDDIWKF